MTNEEFIHRQDTLRLNNRQLADKLGANEGSVSRWRKDMPIPDYIAGYLDLLVAVYQNNIELTLSLGEILSASNRAQSAGLSFAEYVLKLIRNDLVKSTSADYRNIPATASSRLNEDPPPVPKTPPSKGAKSKPAA